MKILLDDTSLTVLDIGDIRDKPNPSSSRETNWLEYPVVVHPLTLPSSTEGIDEVSILPWQDISLWDDIESTRKLPTGSIVLSEVLF